MIIICDGCGIKFKKFPKDIKKCKQHFCTIDCYKKTRQRIVFSCQNCNKQCSQTQGEYQDSKNHFCSKSCSATFNNLYSPKRKRTKKCKICENLILKTRTYCSACIESGKHLPGDKIDETRTIEYFQKKRKDSGRYSQLREHARKIMKNEPQICEICGYNIHVEVCHIKRIRDFPKTATLAEVNSRDNLRLLCRNHHWEFDHGLLNGSAGTRTQNSELKRLVL